MTQSTQDAVPRQSGARALGDPIVLLLSIGFIVAFIGLSFYDVDLVANSISTEPISV